MSTALRCHHRVVSENHSVILSLQLMPYLVMDILTGYPGLPGLFFAAVCSGSLRFLLTLGVILLKYIVCHAMCHDLHIWKDDKWTCLSMEWSKPNILHLKRLSPSALCINQNYCGCQEWIFCMHLFCFYFIQHSLLQHQCAGCSDTGGSDQTAHQNVRETPDLDVQRTKWVSYLCL